MLARSAEHRESGRWVLGDLCPTVPQGRVQDKLGTKLPGAADVNYDDILAPAERRPGVVSPRDGQKAHVRVGLGSERSRWPKRVGLRLLVGIFTVCKAMFDTDSNTYSSSCLECVGDTTYLERAVCEAVEAKHGFGS